MTITYQAHSTANWVDFLQEVEEWLPEDLDCVYAIVDNLSTHRASDVLLFSLRHPCWEFVFQPKYAAYLNLIELWWKILRSLALKGRRLETWAEVEQAEETA
jgi:DDE superfamily endonuclease